MKRVCPIHKVKLEPCKTRYGLRWNCPVEGCTVSCWDGDTSTPADFETRRARRYAHAAFDPLWKQGEIPKGKLFKMLAEYMDLPQKDTHIGHFTKSQCEQVRAFCNETAFEKAKP